MICSIFGFFRFNFICYILLQKPYNSCLLFLIITPGLADARALFPRILVQPVRRPSQGFTSFEALLNNCAQSLL